MDQLPDGTNVFPEVECPYCGVLANAATQAGEGNAVPADGQFSLCFECAMPSIFVIGSFGVALRQATAEENARFAFQHGSFTELLKIFNQWRAESGNDEGERRNRFTRWRDQERVLRAGRPRRPGPPG